MTTTVQSRTTAQRKKAFLEAYALAGNISEACRVSEVGRRTYYDWMASDSEFASAFAVAEESAIDSLELEARRRAHDGVEEPVFGSAGHNQGTVQVGTIRKYSDTLLIFLLKAARPQKYRDRVEIISDVRRAIESLVSDPDERAAAIAEAESILAGRLK